MTAQGTLTDKQRQVLALAVELCDRRQIATTLDVGYVTIDNHLSKICDRLKLPSRYTRFSSIPLDGKFNLTGINYTRVDRAMDRYGPYNAQDAKGRRVLIFYHTIVERVKDE